MPTASWGAGVIVIAVAIALTMAHPVGPSSPALTAVAPGGPALYLAGNALFNYSLAGRLPWSRLIAFAVLGLLAPVALVASPLLLSAATTLVMLILAIASGSPSLALRGHARQ